MATFETKKKPKLAIATDAAAASAAIADEVEEEESGNGSDSDSDSSSSSSSSSSNDSGKKKKNKKNKKSKKSKKDEKKNKKSKKDRRHKKSKKSKKSKTVIETPAQKRVRERVLAVAQKEVQKVLLSQAKNGSLVLNKLQPIVSDIEAAMNKPGWADVPDLVKSTVERHHAKFTNMMSLASSALDATEVIQGIPNLKDTHKHTSGPSSLSGFNRLYFRVGTHAFMKR